MAGSRFRLLSGSDFCVFLVDDLLFGRLLK